MQELDRMSASVNSSASMARDLRTELETIKNALLTAPAEVEDIYETVQSIDDQLFDIITKISGRPVRTPRVEPSPPSISGRLGFARYATASTFYGITGAQREQYQIARDQFKPVFEALQEIIDVDMPNLRKTLKDRGIPWTQGRELLSPVIE